MKSLTFLLLVSASLCACAGEVAPLVEKGAPKACVVVPADAPEHVRTAAAELSKWTKELTGVTLPVGPSSQDGLVPVTFTALPADEKSVRYDGFRLTASERGIEIASKRPYGSVFAVYWLLNRRGGMYWCDPESGVDFTPRQDLSAPAGVTVRNPLPGRQPLTGGFVPRGKENLLPEWNVRNGLPPKWCEASAFTRKWGVDPQKRVCGSLGDRMWSCETNETEIAAEVARLKASGEAEKTCVNPTDRNVRILAQANLQMKKHPERFPLVNGQRRWSGTSFLSGFRGNFAGNWCATSPSARQHLLEMMRAERARAGKDTQVVYSLMCDDTSQWCECENCAKLLTSLGNSSRDDRASDLWWDFINWMAPRLLADDPNASVEVGIYLTYRQPPKKVKAVCCDPERMSVLVCPHGRCHLHSLTDPTCKTNKRYRDMLEVWSDLGFHVNTFEYHCQLPGKGNYAFIEKAWVDDLKWYHAKHMSHTAGGLWGVWFGYDGHKQLEKNLIYRYGAKARWQIINLNAHFAWDPDDDFETERRKLLTAYYRTAAPEMLEYHALLEKAILAPNICMSYGSSALPFTVAAGDPELVRKAKDLLKAADAKAGADAVLKARIERDRQNFYRDWESAAQVASGVKPRRLFTATDPVTVDGVLDEKTWKSATLSDDFRWEKTYNVDAAQAEPLVPHTSYRLAADNENLYLAVVCDKANGKVLDKPATGSVWDAMEGSHLELCLQSPTLNGEYYHFALSHNGKVYSALTTNPTLRDLKKPLGFTHAIKDAPDRWTVEMAIPLKNLGVPKDGEVWRLCVYRCDLGPDGAIRAGTSTGFPLHWMDRWEAYSFGVAGTLAANGSFERGMPAPKSPHNGRNWTFRQQEVPADWHYHHNGGDLDWREGDAAEGRRYIRVTPINAYGGPEFVVLKGFPLFPPESKALDVSFAARGEGEIRFYNFGLKELEPYTQKLDSPDAWKRYSFRMPLNGTHPFNLVLRFCAPKKNAIDLDDVSVLPVR